MDNAKVDVITGGLKYVAVGGGAGAIQSGANLDRRVDRLHCIGELDEVRGIRRGRKPRIADAILIVRISLIVIHRIGVWCVIIGLPVRPITRIGVTVAADFIADLPILDSNRGGAVDGQKGIVCIVHPGGRGP